MSNESFEKEWNKPPPGAQQRRFSVFKSPDHSRGDLENLKNGGGEGDDNFKGSSEFDKDKTNERSKAPRKSVIGATAKEIKNLGKDAFNTLEKNLSKDKPLAFFVLFSIFAVAFLTVEIIARTQYGLPPTELSKEACAHLIKSSICFIVVAIFGFILLACRISNLLLGLLYMFLAVLVMNYSMLSISRGVSSIRHDTFASVAEHLASEHKNKHNDAQEFFDKAQEIHHCCGWGIDITESWPSIYPEEHDLKHNLRDSCCVNEKPGCGKDAGRGWMEKPESGYTLVIPNKSLADYKKNGTISLTYGMGYHTIEESIRAIRIDELEPFPNVSQTVNSTRTNREILKHRPNHEELRKIDYAQTEMGIHAGITHVWDVTSKDLEDEIPHSTLLYFSKGLIETTLFHDIIYPSRCERIERANKSEHLPRLKRAYRQYTFFIGIIHTRMYTIIGFSSCFILMIIILGIFFWSYFSKLKAEQLSDLSPPTDFDLLNLQLPTYGEVDEIRSRRRRKVAQIKQEAKDLEKEIAHIMVAEKLAQAYEEDLQAKAEEGIIVERAPETEMWTQPKLLIREREKGDEVRRRWRRHRAKEVIEWGRLNTEVVPETSTALLEQQPSKPDKLSRSLKRRLAEIAKREKTRSTRGGKKKRRRKPVEAEDLASVASGTGVTSTASKKLGKKSRPAKKRGKKIIKEEKKPKKVAAAVSTVGSKPARKARSRKPKPQTDTDDYAD